MELMISRGYTAPLITYSPPFKGCAATFINPMGFTHGY
jgi:hypothetical protein